MAKKKRRRWKTIKDDGGAFILVAGYIHKVACCACGLTHDYVARIDGPNIIITVTRDNRATAQRRRHLLNAKK